MKLALAQLGPVMCELIEPVQGPSSYEEFLNEHGEGLHHLGYFVEDIDAEISNMESKEFRSCRADGAWARLATAPTPTSKPSPLSATLSKPSRCSRRCPNRSAPTRREPHGDLDLAEVADSRGLRFGRG